MRVNHKKVLSRRDSMLRFVLWKDESGSSMRRDYRAAGGKAGNPLLAGYCNNGTPAFIWISPVVPP